jgi:predicted RNA-binding protein with PIN domain
MIIWGQGARRLSARGLLEEVQNIENSISGVVNSNNAHTGEGGKSYLQISTDILKQEE